MRDIIGCIIRWRIGLWKPEVHCGERIKIQIKKGFTLDDVTGSVLEEGAKLT